MRQEWVDRAAAGSPSVGEKASWRSTYADRSAGVVRFLHWTERRSLERMLRRIGRVGRMVELGCGPGKWFELWRRVAEEVHGLDFVPAFTAEAVRRIGPRVACGDARGVPFKDGAFDLVAVVKVMQFLDYDDQAVVLAEAHRILRPGGRLVFMELLGRPERFGKHVRPRALRSWVEAARPAGFTLDRVEGNEYSPLLRLMEQAVLRVKRMRNIGNKAGSGPGNVANGPHRLRPLLRAVESILAPPSRLLEPVFERLMPDSWAGHGVFLLRKPA